MQSPFKPDTTVDNFNAAEVNRPLSKNRTFKHGPEVFEDYYFNRDDSNLKVIEQKTDTFLVSERKHAVLSSNSTQASSP